MREMDILLLIDLNVYADVPVDWYWLDDS